MPTRTAFYRRRFLNRPRHHLGAHVIASVEPRVGGPNADEPWVDAELHLADCRHCITLDLSAWDARDARNALHKLAALRAVVDELDAALRTAYAEAGLLPTDRA